VKVSWCLRNRRPGGAAPCARSPPIGIQVFTFLHQFKNVRTSIRAKLRQDPISRRTPDDTEHSPLTIALCDGALSPMSNVGNFARESGELRDLENENLAAVSENEAKKDIFEIKILIDR
jgi:hypothetical protein